MTSVRIMIVDDNDDIRILLRHVLLGNGFDPWPIDSGSQALGELAVAAELPAAILLDIQMPDFDGWETLEAIRAEERFDEVAVVLCSVKGRPVDQEKGWLLGCDGYVTKPLDVPLLLEMLSGVISAGPARLRARRYPTGRRSGED